MKSLLVVNVTPRLLQARREKAADFIKSLDDAQLRALAESLQVPADDAVLPNLLLAISGAESDAAFEIISQKIRIHFGEEF
ncbi:hypothetical protein D3C83_196840 [compost metagenome]